MTARSGSPSKTPTQQTTRSNGCSKRLDRQMGRADTPHTSARRKRLRESAPQVVAGADARRAGALRRDHGDGGRVRRHPGRARPPDGADPDAPRCGRLGSVRGGRYRGRRSRGGRGDRKGGRPSGLYRGLERAAPGTAAAFDGEPGAPRSAVAERYGPKHARARRAVDLDPRATSVAASSGRHSRPWNRWAASSPRWRRDAVFVGHPSAGPDGRAVR
jgi:hypothetical protein